MNKTFENPMIEIVEIPADDIIQTSGDSILGANKFAWEEDD